MFSRTRVSEKGMGEGLFTEFPHLTKQADDILGYSIQTLCLENPEESLGKPNIRKPALFVVNAFHYLKRIKEANEKPDYLAGHSLGEYNALLPQGYLILKQVLSWLKKRRVDESMLWRRDGGSCWLE